MKFFAFVKSQRRISQSEIRNLAETQKRVRAKIPFLPNPFLFAHPSIQFDAR
jgi:hypothetical protein